MFENLGTPPPITAPLTGREGVAGQLSNYQGSAIAGFSARIDARAVEIEASAKQILFPFETMTSPVRNDWNSKASILGLEIGRYFVSHTEVFGRFGLGGFAFLPDQDAYLRLGMLSGRQTDQTLFQIDSGALLALNQSRSFLTVGLCFGVRMVSDLWIGARASAQTRLVDSNPAASDNVNHEISLVGVGPWIEYRSGLTQMRASALWHIRSRNEVDPNSQTSTAWTAALLPDFTLSAGVPF
ncbi:MAG: hypothetical protein HYR96_15860 [Deltaproteobacteria bacterium]|nr:hypothetical protein [Deltaproteobacteria bacterium]MBI3294460.1 hypothetical protein [Deltaproteobacteria bacterium]